MSEGEGSRRQLVVVFLDVPASVPTADYLVSRGFPVLGITCQRWDRRSSAPPRRSFPVLSVLDSMFEDQDSLAAEVRASLYPSVHERGVGAVVAFAEQSVEAAASLREAFAVQGIKPLDARRMRDKYIMRCHARDAGIACPDFNLGSQVLGNLTAGAAPLAATTSGSPVTPPEADLLLKPRRGWGCQMIQTFPRGVGLEKWLRDICSAERDQFLVERFICGTLFHVAVIVSGRQRVLWQIARHIRPLLDVSRRPHPHFALLRVRQDDPCYRRLLDFTDACLDAFAPEEGFLEIEIIGSEQTGELYLCEIAGRPATCGVESLYSDTASPDLFRLFAQVVEARLAGGAPPRQVPEPDCHVGLLVRNGEAGMEVTATHLDWGPVTALVCRTEHFYSPGEVMRAGGLADNLARLWVRAPDAAQCERELTTRLRRLYHAEVL